MEIFQPQRGKSGLAKGKTRATRGDLPWKYTRGISQAGESQPREAPSPTRGLAKWAVHRC